MILNRAITNELIESMQKMEQEIQNINRLDMVVSFIQQSGYQLIYPLLEKALNQNIPIRILTSTYMNITDPTALLELYYLLGERHVHLYNGSAPSFHPKAYFFHGESIKDTKIFVGSSNLSKSALTNGVEWNYIVDGALDTDAIYTYIDEFEHLFEHESYPLTKESIESYRLDYIVPKDIIYESHLNQHYKKNQNKYTKATEENTYNTNKYKVHNLQQLFEPNPAQREALLELNNTRNEGNEKALVVAATGIGKTYLAAFDSQKYEKVLFVAHREEILNQAYETFSKVRINDDFGRLFGNYKELDSKILFASVQSLNREENLKAFSKNYFDYMIIDEIHHGTTP